MSELKENIESEFELEKKKLETNIRKLKAENINTRKDLEDEIEELKDKLEKKRLADIRCINNSNKLEKDKLEEDIAFLTNQIENLRSKNTESFFIAENSRNTAEMLAKAEENVADDKINQLNHTIEFLKKQRNSERKENENRFAVETTKVNGLEIECSSLRVKLEEQMSVYKKEKEYLNKELGEIKKKKLENEESISNFKAKAQLADDTIEEFKRKLNKNKMEKEQINEELHSNISKCSVLESTILEKNQRVQEIILENRKEVEQLLRKLDSYANNEIILMEELDEIKEIHEKGQLENDSQGVKNLYSRISELTLELEMLRKSVGHKDEIEEKEERIIAELKKKLNNVEFEKRKLENYMIEIQEQNEVEEETKNSQLTALQNSLLDARERERKLECIRHSLEMELTARNQDHQEILMKSKAAEGKIKEMKETIVRLEQSKTDAENKMAKIDQALSQFETGSRMGTPSRSRRRLRSGGMLEVDVMKEENVFCKLRELVGKVKIIQKEKMELTGRFEMLKLANENLVLNTGRLEEEKEIINERLASSRLQLEKLERKVSVNDQSLAEREESIERLRLIVGEGERKIKSMFNLLDESDQRKNELEDKERELMAKEKKDKVDISKVLVSLKDVKEEFNSSDRNRIVLEDENIKMQSTIREKEEQIQACHERLNHMSDECEKLNKQSGEISRQLEKSEIEVDQRKRVEQDLQGKLEQLQREQQERNYSEGLSKEYLEQLKRQLMEMEQEKQLLADRLENSKSVANEARIELNEMESQMNGMSRRLGEAEQGRHEAEQRLALAGNNTGADTYLKDELNKARKENIGLVEKIKELERKGKMLKSEKRERSESVNTYSRMMANQSTGRVVRTQIPLLSGRPGGHEECGEHAIRIRILEQEVERHLRRVAGLEQQLSEQVQQHRERSEQLLEERKAERERDHTRHASSLKQLEHSLNSRERMYKERISGLEEQVHLLRDQISKEARSRKSYISSSQVISSDVSQLRRQLDESLNAVQNSSRAGLEGGLLERETNRLEHTIARQGREIVGRLTPSKRGVSPARGERQRENSGGRARSSSMDSIGMITSTPVGVGAREKNLGPSLRSSLVPLVTRNSDLNYLTRRTEGFRRGLSPEFNHLENS